MPGEPAILRIASRQLTEKYNLNFATELDYFNLDLPAGKTTDWWSVGGWLWSVASSPATFMFGAWMSALAVALTIAWLPWLRDKPTKDVSPAMQLDSGQAA